MAGNRVGSFSLGMGQRLGIADASVTDLLARTSATSLEEAFMEMTAGAVEYRTTTDERSPGWPGR